MGGFGNSERKILFCFVLCWVFILCTAERGEQQSELIVAHSGKSSLALATHGYQMCRRRGGRRGEGVCGEWATYLNLIICLLFSGLLCWGGEEWGEGEILAAF